MTMQFVTEYTEKKVDENPNFIKYTFYELRLKNNLSEDDVKEFLKLSEIYFTNKGYKIYHTGDDYNYNNQYSIVQDNELLIAIKE